jgi:hypothetical protein
MKHKIKGAFRDQQQGSKPKAAGRKAIWNVPLQSRQHGKDESEQSNAERLGSDPQDKKHKNVDS